MNKIRNALGIALVGLGYLQMALVGVGLLVAEMQLLAADFGTWLAILGFMFFPVLITAMPFYAAAIHGNWNLLILSVGSIVLFWVLMGIGAVIAPSD